MQWASLLSPLLSQMVRSKTCIVLWFPVASMRGMSGPLTDARLFLRRVISGARFAARMLMSC